MYGVRSTSLPIYTAFHASHLAAPDVGAIIGTSPVFTTRIPQGTTLFSPTTGSAYDGETLYEFLRQALHDIFQEKLFPSKTLDSALHRSSGSKLSVHVFGPSNAGGFLEKSLAASGFRDAKVQLSEMAETGEPQDAIAIVGMSGRFPGGDNLQAFWDILVQGKDLHKKVRKTSSFPLHL